MASAELLASLGLACVADDEGAAALASIGKICDLLQDSAQETGLRTALCLKFKLAFFQGIDPDAARTAFSDAATCNAYFAAIVAILSEKTEDQPIVEIAKSMAEVLPFLCATDTTHGTFARALLPSLAGFLGAAESAMSAGTMPMLKSKFGKGDGPPQMRREVVCVLAGIYPVMGGFEGASELYVSGLLGVAAQARELPELQTAVKTVLQMVNMNNKKLVYPHVGKIFALVAAGDESMLDVVMSDPNCFVECPEEVKKNLGVIVKQPFMKAATLLNSISTADPDALVPHVDVVCKAAISDPHFGIMAFGILKEIAAGAERGPEAVHPRVPDLVARAATLAQSGYALAGILGGVAKRDKATAVLMAAELFALLERSKGDPVCPVVLLELKSCGELLGESQSERDAVFTPERMSSIETLAASPMCAHGVEALKDWLAGRSLASIELRVDTIEEAIDQMNGKISASCADFEAVKAYVDSHIEELKEFVATVAKRLPQPQRLSVIGRVRKTIRMHFVCPRTGIEHTLDSKQWNKWLKIGFTALKLGKCALDIGMGNPLGLISTGVDACKEIYGAYKEKDDEEFDTYIREPFLTSAEEDKLIEGLRGGGFFDEFFYDAQEAAWCHNSSMESVDKARVQARAAPSEAAAKNKEVVKVSLKQEVASAAVAVVAGVASTVNDNEDGGEANATTAVDTATAAAAAVAAVAGSKKKKKEKKPAAPAEEKSTNKKATKKTQVEPQPSSAAAGGAAADVESRLTGMLQTVLDRLDAIDGRVAALETDVRALKTGGGGGGGGAADAPKRRVGFWQRRRERKSEARAARSAANEGAMEVV